MISVQLYVFLAHSKLSEANEMMILFRQRTGVGSFIASTFTEVVFSHLTASSLSGGAAVLLNLARKWLDV